MTPSFAERLDDLLVRYIAYSNFKNYVSGMEIRDDDNILEIGCGGGNLSRFLAQKNPNGKLYCVDVSPYWINKARQRLSEFDNVSFFQGEIKDFKDEEGFDVAVIHYVLHDIPFSERSESLSVVKDLLKKKGRIYVREPSRKSHGMSSEEIRLLMKQGGFLEKSSREGYSFPIRGKVYEGVFQNN